MGPNPPRGSEVFLGAIRGYKAALIVNADAGGLAFAGVGYGGTYGAYDVASCVTDSEHVPPHTACSCGFYSWRERGRAIKLVDDETVVLLDVELWGAFHEYTEGVVAAAQRVRQVTVQPYCAGCLASRDRQFERASVLGGDRRTTAPLQPVCDEHAGREQTLFTLAEATEELGAEVCWAADDDPVTQAARELAYYKLVRRARPIRRLDDLLPAETGYVFKSALAVGDDGTLYVDLLARLIQPLPGTDIPIRLGDDGVHEVLLDGLRDFTGWTPRHDPQRFALPVRTIGQPTSSADAA